MRVIGIVLMGLLALACGGDPEPPATASEPASTSRAAANRPPVVREARLQPEDPTVGDTVSLSVKTMDPDNDRLDLRVEWFRNGHLVQDGTRATLVTDAFRRGDQIHALVYTSDGQTTVSTESPAVTLVNQRPRIATIRILPEKPNAGNDLTALADAVDADRDSFEFSYQWIVNGKPLAGATEPTLEHSQFKRNDKVQVQVAASDSEGEGDSVRSALVSIPNAMPEITSDPSQATVSAGKYRYVIKAADPDKDRPLRYTLVDGPNGMAVDLLSGVVSWRVPQRAGGKYPVEVAVADPLGAESRQSFTVELHWESAPADSE